jgi:hypothetical protein
VYQTSLWPKNITEIVALRPPQEDKIDYLMNADLHRFLTEHSIDFTLAENLMSALITFYTAPTQTNMLTCWLGGSAACLVEQLNDMVLSRLCHHVLCRALNITINDTNRPVRVFK